MIKILCLFSLSIMLLALSSCKDAKENSIENSPEEELFVASDLTDSVFTAGIEGPAVDAEGNLYAVSFGKDGTIGITSFDPANQTNNTQLFITLPAGSTGNGIRFDSEKNMFVADYTGHNILKVERETKTVSVFAHDNTMNQPNDVAISGNDILFASDPRWSDNTGNLWRIDKNGQMTLLEDSMGTTNGVEVSTSEKILYVNESVQRNVWAYDLTQNGDISNKRLFIHFDNFGMDGMRCDSEGNLYIARYGKGTIVKISPQGKVITEITLKGKKPTNVAFGGKDGRTCYVTLQDRGVIESFRVDKPGREWQLMHSGK